MSLRRCFANVLQTPYRLWRSLSAISSSGQQPIVAKPSFPGQCALKKSIGSFRAFASGPGVCQRIPGVSPYRQALSFSPATCLGCSLCKERGCGREWHRSLRGRDFFSLQALPRALGFIGILSDPAPPRASGGLCQQCYPRVLGAPPCASILASICLPVPAMTGEPGLKCFLRS